MLTDIARARIRKGWDATDIAPLVDERSRVMVRPFLELIEDPELDPDGSATVIEILAMNMVVNANHLGQIRDLLSHLRLIGVVMLALVLWTVWP